MVGVAVSTRACLRFTMADNEILIHIKGTLILLLLSPLTDPRRPERAQDPDIDQPRQVRPRPQARHRRAVRRRGRSTATDLLRCVPRTPTPRLSHTPRQSAQGTDVSSPRVPLTVPCHRMKTHCPCTRSSPHIPSTWSKAPHAPRPLLAPRPPHHLSKSPQCRQARAPPIRSPSSTATWATVSWPASTRSPTWV